MFKSRKKRQQQKAEAEAQAKAAAAAAASAVAESKYTLLEDFQLTSDFRSSVILPQLNKDLDPIKLSRQQQHLAQLRDIPEAMSPPLSPPPPIHENDGTKQYQDLAAWRHQRSQNRYSNGLFGGKQRGRPKPNQVKRFLENDQGDLEEVIEEDTPATPTAATMTENTDNDSTFTTKDQQESQSTVPDSMKPSIQLKDMLRNEFIHENESEEEQSDEEFIEEAYEPNSDTEENFFFQDFSVNDGNNNNKQRRPRNNNRRRGSTKVMSRFDLSSFAKDLHDHRLSVIQPRESRIIMTEDDELELEKLLERQRQRMSVMTMSGSTESLKIVPPLPSLDLIKPHKSTSTNTQVTPEVTKKEITTTTTTTSNEDDLEDMPKMHSDHGSTTTTNSEIHSATSSRNSQESYPPTQDSNKIAVDLPKEDDVSQSTTTNVIIDKAPEEPVTLKPVASVSASSIRQKKEIQTDRLKRSVSTTSIRSNKSIQLKSTLQPIRDEEEITSVKRNARKSLSMDNIHISLDANETSVTSAALDWIAEDSNANKSKLNPIQPDTSRQQLLYQQAPSKSRSLFGSLRQVSRSKTFQSGNSGVSSIKGLVRNFSSSHQHHRANQSAAASNRDSTGMSRAAMAVIQHNVTKHEQKRATSVIPDEKQDKCRSDNQEEQEKRQTRERSRSDANTGSRLISQLISRATSASRSKKNSTKVVNMEANAAAKKRAQVVRRTIIYVQPDSLHDLLKNGGEGSVKMPPLPTPASSKPARSTVVSDGSLSPDDETVRSREYVTATKVSRQTSVRKRVVDMDNDKCSPLKDTMNNQDDQDTAGDQLSRNGSNSRRRWQLQSMDEDEMIPTQRTRKTNSSSSNEDNSYMEGVELREMSDGSVVWGIVKKQGNRKSFYAPNQKNEYEHIEDEVEDVHGNDYFQKNVMKKSLSPSPSVSRTASLSAAAPPPIPRRSPRRQVSNAGTSANYISTHSSKDDLTTTDIYYSDEVTLPSLLKMMQGHTDVPSDEEEALEDEYAFNERAMSSVDDQLDEMMRILTSQQQQQQRMQKIH